MPLPSYAHGACPTPLLGETVGANLRRTVERFGDRDALVVRHQSFRATYRELWEFVDRAAKGLIARGVKTGQRVETCREFAFPGEVGGGRVARSFNGPRASIPRVPVPYSPKRVPS